MQEDFTYKDIDNLIMGLVIGKLYVENSTGHTEKHKKEQLEKMDKAHASLKKLRLKLEFKDDPFYSRLFV